MRRPTRKYTAWDTIRKSGYSYLLWDAHLGMIWHVCTIRSWSFSTQQTSAAANLSRHSHVLAYLVFPTLVITLWFAFTQLYMSSAITIATKCVLSWTFSKLLSYVWVERWGLLPQSPSDHSPSSGSCRAAKLPGQAIRTAEPLYYSRVSVVSNFTRAMPGLAWVWNRLWVPPRPILLWMPLIWYK